mgnify:CR=1 FL=1
MFGVLVTTLLHTTKGLQLTLWVQNQYLRRLERDLTAILALAPTNRHGKRLRKRYLEVRDGLGLLRILHQLVGEAARLFRRHAAGDVDQRRFADRRGRRDDFGEQQDGEG